MNPNVRLLLLKMRNAGLRAFHRVHPLSFVSVRGSAYSVHDLRAIDNAYRRMYRSHERLHTGMIAEVRGRGYRNVLEVACGTGFNIPAFRTAGLDYCGLDISETAIAVAALKYPENSFLNLGVCECSMLKDGAFDLVYNSSMLEHIGYYREAISEMLRLARKELRIVFFEGLTDEPENRLDFHPYSESHISGRDKDIFGRKVVLQNHIYEPRKGWYWNRYSRARILELLNDRDVQIRDATNTAFLKNETVLVVRKS